MTYLPSSFLEKAKKIIPGDFSHFVDVHKNPPYRVIRINPLKGDLELSPKEKVPWCPISAFIPKEKRFNEDPLWFSGYYYVQEPSSTFLYFILENIKGKFHNPLILDICASPGGKTTIALSVFANKGLVIANEVNHKRINALVENLNRWGAANFIITRNNPETFGQFENTFDIALVDPPCSSEGMFRKDPKIAKKWKPTHSKYYASIQWGIVKNAFLALKPGGVLIYSTCTYSYEENEEVVARLANEYPIEFIDFEVPEEWGIVKGNEIPSYRFFPHLTKGEGFFIISLTKKEPTQCAKKMKYYKSKEILVNFNSENIPYLSISGNLKFYELRSEKDDFQTIVLLPDLIERLKFVKWLRVVKWGFTVGILKKSEFYFSSHLPFSVYFFKNQLREEEVNNSSELLSRLSKPTFIKSPEKTLMYKNCPLVLV